MENTIEDKLSMRERLEKELGPVQPGQSVWVELADAKEVVNAQVCLTRTGAAQSFLLGGGKKWKTEQAVAFMLKTGDHLRLLKVTREA